MDGPPLRVLVTNDDGVRAPGLRWLARAAREAGFDVVVAAPSEEASGMSAALTAVTEKGRVSFTRKTRDDVPTFAVAASPAYIVLLAGLGAFGPPPELVLSGINRGANAGRAILHSGTVGAALTGAAGGARTLAVSLDVLSPADADAAFAALDTVDDEARHWSTAAAYARRLLPWLTGAPAGTVLNLNVPDRPEDGVAGLRRAGLAPFGQVQLAVAESGEDFVRMTLEQGSAGNLAGSDVALLAEGYATVTAVRPLSQADDSGVPTDDAAPGHSAGAPVGAGVVTGADASRGIVRPRGPGDAEVVTRPSPA